MTPGVHEREDGQVVPILVFVVVGLAIAVAWLSQVGLAGTLRAGSQSASDAAALAAGEELRSQAMRFMRLGPGRLDLAEPSHGHAFAAATSYAAANDASVVPGGFRAEGLEVRVEVESRQRLEGANAEELGVAGTRGEASSRARIEVDWRLPRPGPRSRPPLSDAQIEAIAQRNGYDPEDEDVAEQLARSVLRSPATCPGADVRNLEPRMHDVIAHLELSPTGVGAPLRLRDGYRRPGCGGSEGAFGLLSPENSGDAFRTTDAARAGVAARMHVVGLCRPYPSTDPNLFAHRNSAICGGSVGSLDPSSVYGGNLRNVVRFEVRLVRDEGPLGRP